MVNSGEWVDDPDLSMNTVAFRPDRQLVARAAEAAAIANDYPDMTAAGATAALAEHLGLPADHLVFGPGSAALCQLLLLVCCEPGAQVVHQWPSFEGYPSMIGHVRADAVPVALDGVDTDLDAMAAAVTDRTAVVMLCNPNNPTGALLDQQRLRRFLDRLPDHVTVLIDEAYRDFVLDPGYRDALDLVREDPRVCVLRTFSKSYRLAGLRIGYLVAQPALTARLAVLRMFFAPSAPAQAAAVAALAGVAEMRQRCAQVGAERTRLRDLLIEQGWQVPVSQANFLWVPTPDAGEFTRHCAAYGLRVREWAERGVRVTIGSPATNDAFAEVAAGFRAAARQAVAP
ncbi:aminotransferase class I/II-fold pyridoxal phosphate-dependent enzyme [Nocardia terpenica]|uniref:Putative aminotransferase n=1 Tax=Nocardia brasiliensis TaxID=37326 RepID=B1Q2P1_NOCBR|nr:aminotransferase class I/II-fold pyridoxal phosphate-dependent enzyme [Nocardia terpenica]NQE87283.1 aminotransferase class I/II-fold pyridoxal phosphate-dependent enzyme [Nocardia terpenica]QKQ14790.1 Bra1 [Nocardia terpenica]BAG16275.1 putative aminotransferase [Nocardia terpenica]